MLSIIIPFYNEKDNLPLLYKELTKELKNISADIKYEIIFVDDGSTDGSRSFLEKTAKHDNRILLAASNQRLGKGTALVKGFKRSAGDIIVFMDADLQDDPKDLKIFLEKIKQGFDVVNGWRQLRQDKLNKTLPSKIANTLLWKFLLNSPLHDVNCGFKAFRRAVLEEIPLYGDNYRFLPILAEKRGFKTSEVVVHHRQRKYGESKYNVSRIFPGLLDTLTTYVIIRFAEKPAHFFGLIGGSFLSVGFLLAFYLTFEKVFLGEQLSRRPALLLAVLLIIVGIQILTTGILAELLVYLHKRQNKATDEL